MRYVALPLFLVLVHAGCAWLGETENETEFGGTEVNDEFLWLEEVEGEKALAFVREQNARTDAALKTPLYDELYQQALAALNAESRIPTLRARGDYLYNLLKDARHPRGLYRRTTLAEFKQKGKGGGEPDWQTVLDIDALADEEGRKWVLGSVVCLAPAYRHCMVELSPGGSDAGEYREFDLATGEFVDDGFFLPVAKSYVSWMDEDTLIVGTEFDDGVMTDSGYPRVAKVWRRGTSLDDAVEIARTDKKSVGLSAFRLITDTDTIDLVTETHSFWSRTWSVMDESRNLETLEIPESSIIAGAYRDKLVIRLNEDWRFRNVAYPKGAVVVANPKALAGDPVSDGDVAVLIAPTSSAVIEEVDVGKHGIAVVTLENVAARMSIFVERDAEWQQKHIPFPKDGMIHMDGAHDGARGFLARFESFTRAPTLYFVPVAASEPIELAAQEETFDGDAFMTEQYWAVSKDGTRIPYFLVRAKDSELDGSHPVHMFSYGGFRNALTPSYSGVYEDFEGAYGKLWLERGGVFVLANIRGGSEFGPEWHSSVLRENRVKVFEDFEAIAENLVARGVTTHDRIGIEGRSNGGLLVSATMIRRPELYGAVICGVPLADMKRYHRLLAGASWVGEYGNPDDPEDWAFIKEYSPYQNVSPEAEYPPVLFYTSTRDDRVHPGHARKMLARMRKQGHDVYYYENTEGGHGGSSTHEQLAHRLALSYSLLWEALSD